MPAAPARKIVLLHERFGPYHAARLRALSGLADTLALEVVERDRTYTWKTLGRDECPRTTLFPDEESAAGRGVVREAVRRSLDAWEPEFVVIPGWATRAALAALRWCLDRGRRSILLADSTRGDAPRRWATEQAKRRVVGLFDAAVVAGTRHREYVESLGMGRERIETGCDVVDNAHFAAGAELARGEEAALRTRLGLPPAFFLTCARFVPVKNLSLLLKAFATYVLQHEKHAWHLVLAGDGPLRESLREEARAAGIAGLVSFPGFQQYGDLPRLYGLASAFVLPSISESWGLVVNEAMACGLPVLVSRACGCAPDLVQEGVNGFTFDPTDAPALAVALGRMSDRGLDRAAFGEASRRIIASYTPESFARAVDLACGIAAGRPPRKPSALQRFLLSRLSR